MKKLEGAELEAFFEGAPICLVGCLSFEARSVSSARRLAKNGLRTWLCLRNGDIEVDSYDVVQQATEIAGTAGIDLVISETQKRNPLTVADSLMRVLDRASTLRSRVVFDLSTMTHEMVLILVAAIDEFGFDCRDVAVLYSTARQYSTNENDHGRKWISRGIHGVRSVLGYSGLWSPGDRTTLLALPGFDLERVRRIYEELEPNEFIVGIGAPSFAHHEWLYLRNKEVANNLLAGVEGRVFEYPALDPEHLLISLQACTREVGGNVVVAPLNSKVSTLAVGLYARAKPEWQVCYAPALVYNFSYSEPSDVYLVDSLERLRDAALRVTSKPPVEVT